MRLALPSIVGVLMLTFIRAVKSFEVPLLIGTPANLQTFTTAIYQTMHKGFLPQYQASAYSVLLVFLVALPLALYYRATRHAQKYATITGKGYRPARTDLGAWRLPAGIFLLVIPVALVAPLLILLWASFLPIYEPPSVADLGRLSFASYYAVLTRPTTLAGLWNGLIVATLSSAAVTAFTFVLAWTVVRSRSRIRWLIDALATLPLVLPGIVLGTAVLVEFLQAPIIPIYGTIWIMVFAFLVRFMPYGMSILLRRNPLTPRASRRMRAHLRRRTRHHLATHRAAADATGCRIDLDLRVSPFDPRPFGADHAGGSGKPSDRCRHSGSLERGQGS